MAPPRPLHPRAVRPRPTFTILARSTDYFHPLNFNITASGRLARRAFALHELPSLIEVIFSSQDEGGTIRRLLGANAQVFIDVIYEARSMSTHGFESVLIEIYIGTFR